MGSGPNFLTLYLLTTIMWIGQELCKWGNFPGSLQWTKAFAEPFPKYFPKTFARDFAKTLARDVAKARDAASAFVRDFARDLPGLMLGFGFFKEFCSISHLG